MNKIQKLSRFFRILFQLFFVLQPLLLIAFWFSYWRTNYPGIGGIALVSFIPRSVEVLHRVSGSEAFYGFLAGIVPTAITLLILYFLIRLFKLYEKNEIFSQVCVKNIRNVGIMMLIDQLADFFYEGLMGVILTIHNPPGHRLASITFSNIELRYVITAIMIILISWIMNEAAQLQEEQKLIV